MKPNQILQKSTPYLVAIVLFLTIAFIYCSPVMQGKAIFQSDVMQAMGQQKELSDYHKATGDYTLWTNSMFGGMPTYQIGRSGEPNSNIFAFFAKFVRFNLPAYCVDIIFLYLIGFFVLLIALGVNPWLSIIGAIAFAFSSYNFIIIVVGHVNKAFAIGLMPAIIGGVILIYRQKYIQGAILTIISLGIHLYFNHLQMTYYLILLFIVLGIVEFIFAVKEKEIKKFVIASLIVVGSAIVASIPNVSGMIVTYEYSKDTIRGKSELTTDQSNKSSGLDKDYALAWSYGKMETMTLLIPNFYGGGSGTELSTKSASYDALIKNNVDSRQAHEIIQQLPTYWGDQSFTEGPVYMGAIICFLFVFSLFIVKGRIRSWIIAGVILTVLLAWGRNLMWFTDLFFYYFPMYNKFRAVSSILVITSILLPLLSFIGLQQILFGEVPKKKIIDSLKYALYITGGIALFFFLIGPSFFNFVSPNDAQYRASGYPDWLLNAFVKDRSHMMRMDAIRSLVFILLTAGAIYLYIKEKLKLNYLFLLLGFLVLIDMWGIDRRYLNTSDFQSKKKVQELQPTQADLQILQDTDPNFRVYNVASNPFNDSRTSYFHKSIGGYHAAKLRRYQELIEHQISKNNMAVLNMLNTKYFIVPGKDKQPMVQYNPAALGNAWFVDTIQVVKNADEEINALSSFNPATRAFLDERYVSKLPAIKSLEGIDSTGQIKLDEYKPKGLKYTSITSKDRLAVFSEIYYNDGKGWNAYLDGTKVSHVRVNYVLRAMYIPAGKHQIEFKFEPASYYKGQKISMASSLAAGLILILLIAYSVYRSKTAVAKEK